MVCPSSDKSATDEPSFSRGVVNPSRSAAGIPPGEIADELAETPSPRQDAIARKTVDEMPERVAVPNHFCRQSTQQDERNCGTEKRV